MNKIVLYQDKPALNQNLKFGHKVLVNWLEDIIPELPLPYRLAITGDLGVGKSTIIHNAVNELEKKSNYKVAYVDVWKLDQESARRSTLIKVAKELEIEINEFNNLKNSIYGRTTQNSETRILNKFKFKNNYGFLIYLISISTIFAAVFYVLLINYSKNHELFKESKYSILASFGIGVFTLMSNLIGQQILKIKSSITKDPFVGPEEFEEAFQEILNSPKIKGKKVIVIFDNIDRAPKKKIEEILTGISAFFDNSNEDKVRELIILVPFSIRENTELNEVTLQKFFDAIIPMPNLMPEDLLEFSREKLINAGFSDCADEIAQLIDQSKYRTPRAILHFINELISSVNLAEKLEDTIFNKYGEEENYFLSKGAFTKYITFYAKLKLCEKTYQGFIEKNIENRNAPTEVFNLNTLKQFSISNEPNENKSYTELKSFLKATEGIPSQYPESIDQFLYFKGSDTELKIPGGSKIINALNTRNSDVIKEHLQRTNDHKSIEQLFILNSQRNLKVNQRIKNSISTIFDSYEDVKEYESLSKSIGSALVSNEKIIFEFEFNSLLKVIYNNGGKIENFEVFRLLLEHYLQIKNNDEKTREDIKWANGFLKFVLNFPYKYYRDKIISSDFHLEIFEDPKSFYMMKSEGMVHFISSNLYFELINKIFTNTFLTDEQYAHVYGDIINLSNKNVQENDVNRIDQLMQHAWGAIASNLNNEENLIKILRNIFSFTKDLKANGTQKQQFQNLLNLNGQPAVLNKLMTNENKHLFIGLLLVVNKNFVITGHGNLHAQVNNFVISSKPQDFVELAKLFNDWDFFKELEKLSPTQLQSKCFDSEFAHGAVLTFRFAGANYLLNNLKLLINKDNFKVMYENCPIESNEVISKNDLIDHLKEEKHNDIINFIPVIENELLTWLDGDLSLFVRSAIEQIKTNEDLNIILKFIKISNRNFTSMFISIRDEIFLVDKWRDLESFKLGLILSTLKDRSSDFYQQIFDKALERGITSAADKKVPFYISTCVIDMVKENKTSFDESKVKTLFSYIKNSSLLDEEEKKQLLDLDFKKLLSLYSFDEEFLKNFEQKSLVNKALDKITDFVKK